MTATLVDIHEYRGRFFEVLQETERTQTAVMTIAPGQDGGPAETHAGDQVVFVVEGEAIVTVEGTAHQARVLVDEGVSLVLVPEQIADLTNSIAEFDVHVRQAAGIEEVVEQS